jgi:hypothetical protein
MHRFEVDKIVNNIGSDKEGCQYLIVIIDTFSRYIELYKCNDLLETSAVETLVDCVLRTYYPVVSVLVTTSNGSTHYYYLLLLAITSVDTLRCL